MNMSVALDNEETFESLMNPASWISKFFTSVFGVGGGAPNLWRKLLKEAKPLPNEKPATVSVIRRQTRRCWYLLWSMLRRCHGRRIGISAFGPRLAQKILSSSD
jgi:hypothetical protein